MTDKSTITFSCYPSGQYCDLKGLYNRRVKYDKVKLLNVKS